MARNVKISTIGGLNFYLVADEPVPNAELWDKLKEHLTNQVEQVLPDKPDLIVLTEWCDIPREYRSSRLLSLVDYRKQDNVRFFGNIAKQNNCNIAFNTVARGRGDYYTNTTFLLGRDGAVAGQYDKHYVTGGENDWGVRYGTETPLITMDFGKVVCAICFDLNFSDLREIYKALKPELIIFTSQFHGGLMQKVWANECRAYFVGAIAHSKPSSILTPLGELVAYSADHANFATGVINLDYAIAHLKERTQLIELKKAYGPGVTIHDPSQFDYFLLHNNMPGTTIGELMKEYKITSYDDYITESRERRNRSDNQGASEIVK